MNQITEIVIFILKSFRKEILSYEITDLSTEGEYDID